MKYKNLGNSGLMVSQFCFGAMSFGDQWGYGSNEETSKQCFDAFVNAGGNFFDTANNYTDGNSERLLGKFIKGNREKYVIASKCTLGSLNGSNDEGNPNASGNSRKHLREELNKTLKRLDTDYLDILYIHSWDYRIPVEEVMQTLNDFVHEGKVNYLGISNTPAYIVAEANTLARERHWTEFSVYEGKYNPLAREIEREVLPAVEQMGMSLTVWQPLAGSLLSGSSKELELRVKNKGAQEPTKQQYDIIHSVEAVAKKHDASVPQIALAWLMKRSPKVIPIMGARIVDHVTDNLKSLDIKLTDDDMKVIDQASKISLGYPSQDLIESIDGMTYNKMLDKMDVLDKFPEFYKN